MLVRRFEEDCQLTEQTHAAAHHVLPPMNGFQIIAQVGGSLDRANCAYLFVNGALQLLDVHLRLTAGDVIDVFYRASDSPLEQSDAVSLFQIVDAPSSLVQCPANGTTSKAGPMLRQLAGGTSRKRHHESSYEPSPTELWQRAVDLHLRQGAESGGTQVHFHVWFLSHRHPEWLLPFRSKWLHERDFTSYRKKLKSSGGLTWMATLTGNSM